MTPKQRREQDILKRKTSDINKKYPQMAEPLSEMSKPLVGEAFKKFKEENPTSSIREGEYSDMGLEGAAQGAVGEVTGRKKGGMNKGQKKVGKVMSEFKSGKLKSSSGKKVTNPKQAIAIGLSEAGMSKNKMQDGGLVRGSGAAIRGLKKSRIY